MQTSQYAHAVPAILAEMEREREADETEQQPDQDAQEPEKVVYVYRTEDGGLFFTPTKVEDEPEQPTIDAQDDDPETRPTARHDPPYFHFLHFLLLLFLFIALDNVDSALAQLAPVATITITPQVKTISTTATVTVGGSGADVSGRVLAPLTLSQEQTVRATGRGHQDAQHATGTLIYFNGSFAPQTVDAGTIYTGADGVQVATDQTITIPAATPGNPPQFGQATVSASAIHAGAHGNIQNGDINITGSTLQVSNSQFYDGQDARDFTYVTRGDIDRPAATLKAQVTQSMQAALQGQVRIGEQLLSLPCSPTTSADHRPGDEAQSVTVAVTETCTSIAYNPQELERAGISILTAQAAKTLGKAYTRIGDIHFTLTRATNKKNVVFLSFTCSSTWVYQINETHLKALVSGKPRLTALHILSVFPGVQSVSIAGVSDNQTLPTDTAHIHLLIFVEG